MHKEKQRVIFLMDIFLSFGDGTQEFVLKVFRKSTHRTQVLRLRTDAKLPRYATVTN